jgi:hypothetical protein
MRKSLASFRPHHVHRVLCNLSQHDTWYKDNLIICQASGTKLDQDERQRNKKLRQDGEVRNLSREERKMTVIM